MLSLNQAKEIQASILAYLKATFTFQDKEVHQAFYDFVKHPKDGLFKGPYVSLKLPFVKADEKDQAAIPLTIKPDWLPYDHQVKSWHRLSTADQQPAPTIITTGTGSGKTESFMYPVLDFCYRNLSRRGIKVIILYPMNALATDQAKRLGEAIYEDERLRGKVTAGLFIGVGKDSAKYPKTMGKDHIIENRESIVASPPDILLTNFKMLDYGLMKGNFNDLWLGNYQDKTLLQFLVLDELHTYDGAQGTDVANLIRRLKLKLEVPENHLCPIGTSATIGSGEEAPQLLSDYASKIFGETITPDCIITENRVLVDRFFDTGSLDKFIPRTNALKEIKPITGEGYEKYIKRQVAVWQSDSTKLADDLIKLKIVKDLVSAVNRDNKGIQHLDTLIRTLSNTNEEFRATPQWDEAYQFNPKEALVLSLFALISEAKVIDEKNGRKSPFLYTQTQIWIRELNGILRVVNEKPIFSWKENIDQSEEGLGMPPWFCRDCGASGWLGVKHDNRERFEKDVQDVYSKFFSNHKHIYFANRTSKYSQLDAAATGYEATDVLQKFIHNEYLEFSNKEGEEKTDITAFRKLNNKGYADHVCPECTAKNTVSIIGTRIATLSSIAVSQTLSTDLDEQNEQQRKVLAFTNSVQDAAHQAGFVEARNYRFTFRSSLQKVINKIGKAVTLTELSEEFIKYWKANSDEGGNKPLAAYYSRFYPSDYIGKSAPEDYADKGNFEAHFVEEFDERIRWEVFAEFGYNSLIGRTLEKTKSSAVHFDNADLKVVWEKMEDWLKANELTNTVQASNFLLFLELVLHRIRSRGAISHLFLEKFRSQDLKLWDLNWMKDSRHFLHRKFGPRTRIPKLLTSQIETRGILDSTHAKTVNWFHAYYKKSFQLASASIDIINEFYEQLMIALKAAEIFDEKNKEEQINYALNPAKIFVSKQVIDFECNDCGHQIYTSATTTDLAKGKCLTYRCNGHYEKGTVSNDSLSYYQLVYNRNRAPRIYAADHTGLLERKQREIVENDFKNRPKFDSKNVMVATSTLEMGIDIGSLNTAINNSIPPRPSNFLQRIGRAGRATGSALIVNFAKGQAHDLFYYGDPFDMMSGEVATPGCYIEAKEILKRHFFAFCIDSWTKSNPNHHNIPSMIRHIKIETTDLNGQDFFMNQILNYIKINEDDLFNSFKSGYKKDVKEDVFVDLKYDLTNDAFYQFHKKIFSRLKNEIDNIKEKQKDIKDRIKELKLGKEDPERIELEREKKNLGGIIMSIKKRSVLEHLTNVGALPNYAFPETGVTLMGKVLGNKAIASDKPPMNKDFELVRSASQAIKEFAPDNYFYSQGFKLLVTGINTFDWADKSTFHKKRFCSNCDHIEFAETATAGNCPKCGDASWSAASNVHAYAKLLTVKSFNNQSDASLNDSNAEREKLFYNVRRHFKFDKNSSLGAHAIKEIPFGIEFVKNISVTEENLGRSDVSNARKIKINELEIPAHGFITCKHCGKSSSNFYPKDYKFHYGYCKYKESKYDGKPDEVFEEVFFFREIQTEALKILLPVQELNSESEIKMFKAGIELGLKKYFKGHPDHINLIDYSEYNHTTNKFDKYLVLIDSIPGGTGYLEKLFDAKEFSALLKDAYSEIKNCSCQLSGKDGCYRCIYSYSNQFYQLELSRAIAEKRFEGLVKRSEDWDFQPNGLGNLTNKGNIEESELEERFIRSLKQLAKLDNRWKITDENDDGTISYVLQFKDENKNFSYTIRPQINLGRNDGIEFHTRADFLFICTEFSINNEPVEDIYAIPRIAIYLDGFQYHASAEHNRFANDFKKRKAIAHSNNHISWTLTWEDVELFDSSLEEGGIKVVSDSLNDRVLNQFADTRKRRLSISKRNKDFLKLFGNNFSRLIHVIGKLTSTNEMKTDISYYLSFFHKKFLLPSYDPKQLDVAFNGDAKDDFCIRNKTMDGLIEVSPIAENELVLPKIFVNMQKGEMFYSLQIKSDEKIDKSNWNDFWCVYNMLQFFETYKSDVEVTQAEIIEELTLSLEEICSGFDKRYHELIQLISTKESLRTEEDEMKLYSLLDDSGNVIAEADFIINSKKLFVNPFSEQDKKVFEKMGYKSIAIDEIQNIKL